MIAWTGQWSEFCCKILIGGQLAPTLFSVTRSGMLLAKQDTELTRFFRHYRLHLQQDFFVRVWLFVPAIRLFTHISGAEGGEPKFSYFDCPQRNVRTLGRKPLPGRYGCPNTFRHHTTPCVWCVCVSILDTRPRRHTPGR